MRIYKVGDAVLSSYTVGFQVHTTICVVIYNMVMRQHHHSRPSQF